MTNRPVVLCALAVLLLSLGACARPQTVSPAAPAVAIAVVPFAVAGGGPPPPVDVAQAIASRLETSGGFAAVPRAELPAQPKRLREIRWDDWRRAGVDYLVIGLVAQVHDGGHEVEFRLVDARSEQSVLGFLVPSAPEALSRTCAEIADMIRAHVAAAPAAG